MSEKEKIIVEKVTRAVDLLPEDKCGDLVGYAEGVIAARASTARERSEKEPA